MRGRACSTNYVHAPSFTIANCKKVVSICGTAFVVMLAIVMLVVVMLVVAVAVAVGWRWR